MKVGGRRPYHEYRATGVGWLGTIPEHWTVQRLKDVAEINSETLPEQTATDYSLQYIDISNVNSNGEIIDVKEMRFEDAPSRARRRVRHGDTIISTVRTYLKAIALIDQPPDDLIASTGFAVLRPRSGVFARYLWRLVQSQEFIDAVVAHSEGVGYPAIAPTKLAVLPTWLPPFAEQRAIADFLDRETARIDALIARKQRLIDLLQEKRTALISHAVTKGLDASVAMKESGVAWLGNVPAHWKLMRVRHLSADMVAGPFGSSLTKDMYTTEGFRVYGQEQVIPGDFSIGDYYIPRSKYHEMMRYAVRAGDMLISCVGTFGKVAVVPCDAEEGIINPRLVKLTPDTTLILPEYLELFLKSKTSFAQMELFSRGGTMGVINLGLISDILVAVPPIEEQQQISTHVNLMGGRLEKSGLKIQEVVEKLQEYRTALISAAVTGKIDVREEVGT